MHFTISFADDGKNVCVFADKQLVFDACDVESVQLERTSSSFKLAVMNRAGDKRIFSPRGMEIVRAGESSLERVGRLLERLERDFPSPQKAEATGEVSTAVAQDIGDFLTSMKGKSSDDEEE